MLEQGQATQTAAATVANIKEKPCTCFFFFTKGILSALLENYIVLFIAKWDRDLILVCANGLKGVPMVLQSMSTRKQRLIWNRMPNSVGLHCIQTVNLNFSLTISGQLCLLCLLMWLKPYSGYLSQHGVGQLADLLHVLSADVQLTAAHSQQRAIGQLLPVQLHLDEIVLTGIWVLNAYLQNQLWQTRTEELTGVVLESECTTRNT